MRAVVCLGVPSRRLPELFGVSWVWPDAPGMPRDADVVVRWGTTAGPVARLREYNRAAVLARLGDRHQRLAILREAGVPVSALRPRQYYRVALWDLRPCLMRRIRPRRRRRRLRPRRVSPWASDRTRRIVEMACRALHALRLDFGVVDLRVRSSKDIAVLNVDPAPQPDGREGRALLRAFHNRLYAEHDRTFKIGADPELLFYDRLRGRYVPASRFLTRRGALGLDDAHAGRARPIAELRPSASTDPDVLWARLRRLLSVLSRRVRGRHLAWIAGSGSARFPIGGHIHFGGIPFSAALLRALDTYLAIPVLLLEDPVRARRRRRKYGWLGDFRRKGWGFEYRTLPSWLVGPRQARAVLTLAWLIARHWPRLRQDPFVDPALLRAFRECRKEPFYDLFPRLWSEIQALPDYPERAEALSIIPQRIAERRVWREREDLRTAWGIRRR